MILSNLLVYSAICSIGLMLIYGAIRLSRVGMTVYGRIAILASVLTVVAAAAIPLIVGWNTRPIHVVEVASATSVAVGAVPSAGSPSPSATFNWPDGLGLIYIIGVIIAFAHMLLTIVRIVLLISRAEREGDIRLSRREDIVPFSWGGCIVMSRTDYAINGPILAAHEAAHKDAAHWADLMIMNLLGCLTWYCPAARLIRRELQATHEFEADRAVLAAGFDPTEYQMLLISKASGKRFANSISDCLTNNPLKQRILMMQKKASGRGLVVRSLTLIPATLALIALASSPALASLVRSTMPARTAIAEIPALNATEVEESDIPEEENPVCTDSPAAPDRLTVNVADEAPAPSPAPVDAAKETITDEDNIYYETVDTEPEFPGGKEGLYNFLATNIRYPEECAKRDIQGTVYVKYIVMADGSIGDVRVVKGVDPELDGEAVRVVRRLPRYTPGKLGKSPVDVCMSLPISFKLQ